VKYVSPVRRTGFLGSSLKATSLFGPRIHPITKKSSTHNGVDLGIPQGTPLFAAAPGVVHSADGTCRNKTSGGYVTLKHADGSRTSYVHLSRVDVRPGQQVERWTQIGLSGGRKGSPCAGRSTGPHLHFIVRPDGKNSVDPVPLVNWYPFDLTYRGRRIAVASRKWGGAVSALRQMPWWAIALGSAAGMALLVLIVKRPTRKALPLR
jgi:murein DD-endopeptidase MepM/ murein hydrolase activator NlpD